MFKNDSKYALFREKLKCPGFMLRPFASTCSKAHKHTAIRKISPTQSKTNLCKKPNTFRQRTLSRKRPNWGDEQQQRSNNSFHSKCQYDTFTKKTAWENVTKNVWDAKIGDKFGDVKLHGLDARNGFKWNL